MSDSNLTHHPPLDHDVIAHAKTAKTPLARETRRTLISREIDNAIITVVNTSYRHGTVEQVDGTATTTLDALQYALTLMPQSDELPVLFADRVTALTLVSSLPHSEQPKEMKSLGLNSEYVFPYVRVIEAPYRSLPFSELHYSTSVLVSATTAQLANEGVADTSGSPVVVLTTRSELEFRNG